MPDWGGYSAGSAPVGAGAKACERICPVAAEQAAELARQRRSCAHVDLLNRIMLHRLDARASSWAAFRGR
jgi:hypothetical protein